LRQVGYLQELNRDGRSSKHNKFPKHVSSSEMKFMQLLLISKIFARYVY